MSQRLCQAILLVAPFVAQAGAEVTYSRDVAPILFQKCTPCHHPNDIAPMSLLDYKSVRPWAKAIRQAVLLRKMPPWFADPTIGHFANDPSLREAEKRTIIDWVDQGAKEGDPRDLPPAPVYTDGWRIGKPDVVIDIGQDHALPAGLQDEYAYITVPGNFTEGHWVRAVELRPGNRKLVHHAHVIVVPPKPNKEDATQSAQTRKGPSFSDYLLKTPDGLRHMKMDSPVVNDACAYSGPEMDGLHIAGEGALTSYLPGMPPDTFPEDTAKWIPAGSQIRFEIHYHNEFAIEELRSTTDSRPAPKSAEVPLLPNGAGSRPVLASRETPTDRTSVGLIFAHEPPRHPLRRLDVDENFFAIPPNTAAQEVKQCATFESDSLLLSLMPHMHYLGKDARFEIQRPGQAAETLLFVPNYDFNWQLKYRLQDPIAVPKGTRLILTFHYDNSANNPADVDPQRTVRWGEPSKEEMMSGWIDYIGASNGSQGGTER